MILKNNSVKVQMLPFNKMLLKLWFSDHHCLLPHLNDNELTLGRFEYNFEQVVFNLILVSNGWGMSCKIALGLLSLDLTDDNSTLI